MTWVDADGNQRADSFIESEILEYVKLGGVIYVGADSMLYNASCSFASVIAFHDNQNKIAKYFYKKKRVKGNKYADIKLKIIEEVNLAIQCAQFVTSVCPTANVELHVDIGQEKQNLTSKFYNLVKGWVHGLGYKLKVKPNSWASSSVADWHTK